MKKAIQPYLHFEDNCKEAMQFYQSIFGGELELMVVGESPAKEEFPIETHNQILHASLRNEEFSIMASDMCGQGPRTQGNTVQLNLDCSSEEEINDLYQQLSQEGQIVSELKEEFWGDLFAMVIDKFGVQWMMSLEIKKG
ncbi:VOC family protein [Geofilum rubicundum]|uniref:PhnB protein n=1 Tax=Geofilum rubicundum JCM 15548 TaxID=1236989 RepID=A0A0E9LTJ4_9BACT|nr:VOC family protein [Geofilum rubicundum]GAO28887.1 PhnB protein [Geofilum rubicundum JCM 15548]